MSQSLVIVESPAKAKTINHYLGQDYIVKASMGHVRDLPKKQDGRRHRARLPPTYEVIPDKKKVVAELRKRPKRASGSSWRPTPTAKARPSPGTSASSSADEPEHLPGVFNEITEEGIKKAFKHLGQIDLHQVRGPADPAHPRPARRLPHQPAPLEEDRPGPERRPGPVGRPAAHRATGRRRSRPSSPRSTGRLGPARGDESARASRPPWPRSTARRPRSRTRKRPTPSCEACGKAPFVLDKIKVEEKRKHPAPALHHEHAPAGRLPPPPLSGQEDDVRRPEALRGPGHRRGSGRRGSSPTCGPTRSASPTRPRPRPGRTSSRPTRPPTSRPSPTSTRTRRRPRTPTRPSGPAHLDLPPDKVKPYLKKEEYDLYKLVWNRFIASQMAPAVVEETDFDIRSGRYLFKAKGEVLKFDGFLAVGPERETATRTVLPKAFEGEVRRSSTARPELETKQKLHRAARPATRRARWSRSSRPGHRPAEHLRADHRDPPEPDLRRQGQGQVHPDRAGDVRHGVPGQALPRAPGRDKFTAHMEEELDEIGDGERGLAREPPGVLRAPREVPKGGRGGRGRQAVRASPSTRSAPSAARTWSSSRGRFGRFKACSGYPECTHRESLVKKETKPLDEKCPQCGSPLVHQVRPLRLVHRLFLLPEVQVHPEGQARRDGDRLPARVRRRSCPRKTRRGKFFFGCSRYPKCKYRDLGRPGGQACPHAGPSILYKKNLLRGDPYLYCQNEKCTYKEDRPGGRKRVWGNRDARGGAVRDAGRKRAGERSPARPGPAAPMRKEID